MSMLGQVRKIEQEHVRERLLYRYLDIQTETGITDSACFGLSDL